MVRSARRFTIVSWIESGEESVHTLYTVSLTLLGVYVSYTKPKTVYGLASVLSFGPIPICGH